MVWQLRIKCSVSQLIGVVLYFSSIVLFSASDINECELEGFDDCVENSTCTNNEGSFLCECNAGFSGNGVELCEGMSTVIINFMTTLLPMLFPILETIL